VEERHGRRAQTGAGTRSAKVRNGHALVTTAGQLAGPPLAARHRHRRVFRTGRGLAAQAPRFNNQEGGAKP